MNRSEKLTIAVIAAIFFGLFGWPIIQQFHGMWAGRTAAEVDIAAGHLRLHDGGRTTPLKQRYEQIAQERYGIEVINIGCSPNGFMSGYIVGYDGRVQVELDRRFPGVTPETLWQEAEKSLR